MTGRLTFEDFPAGEVAEYGHVEVSAEDIVAFALEFDPQPFHLDDDPARHAAGGLIASGWHTSALLLRMNCDAFLSRADTLGEGGIEEIKWKLPVRPGDRLRVRRHTLAACPGGPQGDVGEVEFLVEVVRQDGMTVMTQRSFARFRRRDRAGGQ
jgi:acyl dehydratase